MVTAAYALGLMYMRDPLGAEIFANEIDAKVAARVFNLAYLCGARFAVVDVTEEVSVQKGLAAAAELGSRAVEGVLMGGGTRG